MVVQLLPHQEKAVGELSNGKVLVGGVGTGKTVTALAYYYTKILGGVLNDYGSIKTPTDLYVFTTARKRDDHDWQKWAAQLGISTKKEYSLHGIQLVVDSYNNIEKYKDIKDSFVILDEQRLVGSGAWSRAFIKIAKSNRWIMLSATPGDTWMDYVPLFVANGFYKNRTEFKRDHCVYSYFGNYPKLERYISIAKLKRLERQILVEMPYDRHTTRHIREVAVDYDRELFAKVVKKRWHVYENRPLKDVAELFSVMRKVVNSDSSRLSAVRNLVQKHSRVIVFYNFDYELEMLRNLTGSIGTNTDSRCPSLTDDILLPEKLSNTTSSSPPHAISVVANSVGVESHAASSVGPDADLGKEVTCELGSEDASKLDEQKFGSSKSPSKGGVTSVGNTTSRSGDQAHPCDAPIAESSDLSINEDPWKWTIWAKDYQPPEDRDPRDAVRSTIAKYEYEKWLRKSLPLSERESCQQTSQNSSSGSRLSANSSSTPGSRQYYSNISSSNAEKLSRSPSPSQSPAVSRSRQDDAREPTPRLVGTTSSMASSALVVEHPSPPRCGTERTINTITYPTATNTSLLGDPNRENGDTSVPFFDSPSRYMDQKIVELAEWNGHKHEPVPTSDSWIYLVQYVAGAEAWNCVTTDTVIFFSLTYSYKNFEQAQGRIDRLDTPYSDLYYYVLLSDSPIDRAVAKALKGKESFNERKYLGNT